MLTVRCVRCDHLFKETAVSFLMRDAELEFRCPRCGTHCFPGRASDFVTLSISWQRLRFLANTAMDHAHAKGVQDDVYLTLRAILNELAVYRPTGELPLTIEEYVAEQNAQGKSLDMIDDSGVPRLSPRTEP
jgi:uncharacterized C2H2 Zn-finger protein